jgi:uncharacterized protein (DUF1800 family)
MRVSVRLAVATAALALSCTCGTSQPSASAPAATMMRSEPLTARDARHLLNRAAFGPAPGDVERVTALGLDAWLTEQFDRDTPDPEVAAAIAPYARALAPQPELLRHFEHGEANGAELLDGDGKMQFRVRTRELLLTLEMVKVSRHVASAQQLREVMLDFWVNHFNVLGTKAQLAIATPDYLEGLRSRAFGRFSDLLLFTAQHPTMLVYLDNATSVALPARKRAAADGFRGLNENYARELLELHTLGVDGGYTQTDVRELARVLTGWGVERGPDGALVFAFKRGRHDEDQKVVLGERVQPGDVEEGQAVLERLARHPATGRHLAHKLCRRFVADTPPDDCVVAVANAHQESQGDIALCLRALFAGKWFWAEEVRGQKLKSPLEFVVSAARALGTRPDGTLRLGRRIGELGEGLFLYPPPTGYPEHLDAWLSGGSLLARLELSVDLARGKPAGLFDVALGATGDLAAGELRVLGEPATQATREAIQAELERLDRAPQRERATLALLVGSPEFQRQ